MSVHAIQGSYNMTEDQVRQIAAEAAREAVKQVVPDILVRLGFSPDSPLDMQRDMQHLRAWRVSVESIQSKTILTLVGLAISGAVAAIIVGARELFSAR